MTIFTLPPELLARIISEVTMNSTTDLVALAQTCRIFHQLFMDQGFDLLMEILKRPRLGQYVQEIQQLGQPGIEVLQMSVSDQRRLGPEEMSLLSCAVQRAGFTGREARDITGLLLHRSKDIDDTELFQVQDPE
ncbi:hypothetical protein N7539_008091 [Penicillium diatomitis]|uniref:F-box domain-containing protein n=1 Tax=Penicillium diatomitis TaxID=2819901 RepID=A0A9W9WT65_9EURO|nr:uncharacterized protein N7539_008091 [Penicillium diatomitis]KAJ5475025.1 hypothetical protein N7539_008091 [Penicillium diatomitis]